MLVILAHHKAPEKHHCKGEYLKRASFLIGSHAIGSHARKQASEILSLFRAADQRRPGSRETGCAIRYFRKADIVKCLDEFRDRRSGELATILNATKERPSDRALHIAFLGDSRIRQQFLSFSQVAALIKIYLTEID